jgi:hypothetical protein
MFLEDAVLMHHLLLRYYFRLYRLDASYYWNRNGRPSDAIECRL